jgi:hypothetical protein
MKLTLPIDGEARMSLDIEGCEEILDPPSHPGTRTFLCPWSERFRVAYMLVQLFGNVEINGHGRLDEHDEPSHAAIAAGASIRP